MAIPTRLSPAHKTLSATTITTSLTTIGAAIDVSWMEEVYVRIDNAGATAFNAFNIDISPDGTNFETYASTSGDYTSPQGKLISVSSDLTSLGAGATGWFILNVVGIKELRLQASVASGTTENVVGQWSAN